MRYQREQLDEALLDEIEPVARLNQRETGSMPDRPLAIDRGMYLALERSGVLRIYTARSDGELVGYVSMLVRDHPHTGVYQAHQDALFVAKEHRKGFVGPALLRYADEELRREGVDAVYRQSSFGRDISELLTRMGYYETDRTYMRRLDHGC